MQNVKYPRTPHLREVGVSLAAIARSVGATRIVIEEKLDGANAGLQFSPGAEMMTRSRGNFLQGGYREKQFDLFRKWADWLQDDLFDRIEDKRIVYGEWMFARHSIFYDRLPHLFHEFDILDIETGMFLSTPARAELLAGLPVVSVPVLYDGPPVQDLDPRDFIARSVYQSTDSETCLLEAARRAGVEPERAVAEGDRSGLMEGVYIKLETDEHTIGRIKYVRPDFSQVIIESGSHWADRPLIANHMPAPEKMFMTTADLSEQAREKSASNVRIEP